MSNDSQMNIHSECNPVESDNWLKMVRDFYNRMGAKCNTRAGSQYRQILAQYYARLIPQGSTILEVGCGNGELLSYLNGRERVGIDLSEAQIEGAMEKVPEAHFEVQSGEHLSLNRKFDYIIVSETINQASDVQRLFERLASVAHPKTRLILNFYNTAWRPFLGFMTFLGFKAEQPPANWLSAKDVHNLLNLAGWELLKQQARVLMPISFFGLAKLINRYFAPLLPWFCLSNFQIARLAPQASSSLPSVSIIVTARNEAGNIRNAISRMPRLGSHTEVIFIEGGSKDNTWEEILKVVEEEKGHWDITALQQTGKGKGNAVREAFDAAKGDILIIQDGDLTVPPEELTKFYEVLASNKAEFCNGVRLVYPMERQAMQFWNLCANKAFGLIFTWALDHPIKDTLCGTKGLYKSDYLRVAANRSYFGDFDPFGDFDLLFGADHLLLKIMDIPVRYRDRTYGSTNISRWRHGVLLLRMLIVAIRKLKLG